MLLSVCSSIFLHAAAEAEFEGIAIVLEFVVQCGQKSEVAKEQTNKQNITSKTKLTTEKIKAVM